jgi:hypothetical protein
MRCAHNAARMSLYAARAPGFAPGLFSIRGIGYEEAVTPRGVDRNFTSCYTGRANLSLVKQGVDRHLAFANECPRACPCRSGFVRVGDLCVFLLEAAPGAPEILFKRDPAHPEPAERSLLTAIGAARANRAHVPSACARQLSPVPIDGPPRRRPRPPRSVVTRSAMALSTWSRPFR